MICFYLLMFVFAFFAQIDICNIALNHKIKKRIYYCLILLLILFAGLRYYEWPRGVDIFDYGIYESAYLNPVTITNFWEEYLSLSGGTAALDPGYIFVSSFFSRYVFSLPNFFFLLISAVSVLLLVDGFRRNQIYKALFIVLYVFLERIYFQYNFIMMRQGLSMAIVWWGLPYVVNRKFLSFMLCCVCGAIFHTSALFFLLVYWIYRVNVRLSLYFCVALILSILVMLGGMKVLVMEISSVILGLLGMSRYLGYLYSDWPSINMLNFVELFPFICIILRYKKELESTQYGKLFFNMILFYLLLLILIYDYMGMIRLSSYFIYPYLFLLSFIWRKISVRKNRILLGIVVVIYFSIYGSRLCLKYFDNIGYNVFLFN